MIHNLLETCRCRGVMNYNILFWEHQTMDWVWASDNVPWLSPLANTNGWSHVPKAHPSADKRASDLAMRPPAWKARWYAARRSQNSWEGARGQLLRSLGVQIEAQTKNQHSNIEAIAKTYKTYSQKSPKKSIHRAVKKDVGFLGPSRRLIIQTVVVARQPKCLPRRRSVVRQRGLSEKQGVDVIVVMPVFMGHNVCI